MSADKLRDIDRELGERLKIEPAMLWYVQVAGTGERMYAAALEEDCSEWISVLGRIRAGITYEAVKRQRWPAFSTDGNAMLQLIELMAKRGYRCEIIHDERGYLARFTRIGEPYMPGLPALTEAKEAPLCVSQAALKALRTEAGR